MEKATREKLAKIAKDMAQVPFHGDVDGMASNLASIVRLFPTWNLKEADGLWCAAFVYYCCMAAGFEIPYRPEECKTCHLAGGSNTIKGRKAMFRKRETSYSMTGYSRTKNTTI